MLATLADGAILVVKIGHHPRGNETSVVACRGSLCCSFRRKATVRIDRRSVLKSGGGALLGAGMGAQAAPPQKTEDCNCSLGADGSPLDTGSSELRAVIER